MSEEGWPVLNYVTSTKNSNMRKVVLTIYLITSLSKFWIAWGGVRVNIIYLLPFAMAVLFVLFDLDIPAFKIMLLKNLPFITPAYELIAMISYSVLVLVFSGFDAWQFAFFHIAIDVILIYLLDQSRFKDGDNE